jgi:lysophospholipase L1-like esterase
VDSVPHTQQITILPADTFVDLERPELFADGLHLNREGRPVFSARVAKQTDAILARGSL